MRDINFQIVTWNVGSTEPPNDKDLLQLLQLDSSTGRCIDIYAVYFQEIETGLVETAKSFVKFDDWTKSFNDLLSKWKYYLVANVRVQGITLSVYSLLTHLPYIRYIKTDIERTGALASTWGNKGGVAVSCSIYSKLVCFLNTHLAAHLTDDDERVEDFQEVIDEIDFDETTTVFEHEIVFWAGDLNFRLEKIERDEAIKIALEKGPYDKLLQYDQLKKHLLKPDCIFAKFTEGPISFPPTYKFDRDTSNYDTSEKQRKPAYTDRILHRVNPDKSFIQDLVKLQLKQTAFGSNSSYADSLVKQVPGSYKSLPQFRQSDHKPVTAQYTVSIGDYPAPLVELSVNTKLDDSNCDVDIVYNHGMVANDKDYLALYEETFTDANSYKTYKYVEVTNETEVTEKFHKICRFSPGDVKKQAKFRIGYYSYRMSCLLALTEPFVLNC